MSKEEEIERKENIPIIGIKTNVIKEIAEFVDNNEIELMCQEEIIKNLENEMTVQNFFKENKNYIIDHRLQRKFYYRRDVDKHPRVTICLIKNSKGIVCRGVAICSYNEETLDKEIGRDFAEARAVTALKTMANSEKIRSANANAVFCNCINEEEHDLIKFKSTYDAKLTEFESKMFSESK